VNELPKSPSEEQIEANADQNRRRGNDVYRAELNPSRAWTSTIRTDCPRCRYDLIGLSVGSNCPECGLLIGTVSDQKLPASVFGTTALLCGILAFPGCVLFGVGTFVFGSLAIVFWLVTRHEVRTRSRSAQSLPTAQAGAICGATAMILIGTALLIL
jgi:hypothetical protein